MISIIKPGAWYTLEFLKDQGIKDLSKFEVNPSGWDGKPKYRLNNGTLTTEATKTPRKHQVTPVVTLGNVCPICKKPLNKKQKTCSVSCRKKLSRVKNSD